jgi:hypothetical protein
MKIAKLKNKSPIRFTIKACSAALFACIFLNQYPTKRQEHNPTDSQPTNNWSKLSAVTKIIIPNVNNDR